MCLTIRNVEEYQPPKVAEKDIPCFKILKKLNCGTLEAPYRNNFRYKLGTEYKSELDGKFYGIFNMMEVERGLHTSCTYHDAMRVAEHIRMVDFQPKSKRAYEYKIYEAVIPAGSEYYEGDFQIEGKSYASSALRVVKELNYVP